MIENNQPGPLTDDCISQAMLVTYEKLINDSKHENSFLIKVEKGLQRKGAVDIRFLTMFENVKEFAERNRIFYKFKQTDSNYLELKEEYLAVPESNEGRVFLRIAFPSSANPNEPKRIVFIHHEVDLSEVFATHEEQLS